MGRGVFGQCFWPYMVLLFSFFPLFPHTTTPADKNYFDAFHLGKPSCHSTQEECNQRPIEARVLLTKNSLLTAITSRAGTCFQAKATKWYFCVRDNERVSWVGGTD